MPPTGPGGKDPTPRLLGPPVGGPRFGTREMERPMLKNKSGRSRRFTWKCGGRTAAIGVAAVGQRAQGNEPIDRASDRHHPMANKSVETKEIMSEVHLPESPSAGTARTGQRRIRVLLTALLAMVAVIGTLEVVTTGGASASTVNAVATIADATNDSYLPSGASTTPFTVTLPANAACDGDTANSGYHVYSYLVHKGTNVTPVTFVGNSPPAQSFGIVNMPGSTTARSTPPSPPARSSASPTTSSGPAATSDGLLPTLLYTGSALRVRGRRAGLLPTPAAPSPTTGTPRSSSRPTPGIPTASCGRPSRPERDAVPALPRPTRRLHRGHGGHLHPDGHRNPDPGHHRDRHPADRRDLHRGALTGTPTVTGTFPITFTATNGNRSPGDPELHPDRQLGRLRSRHHLGQQHHIHAGHGRHLHRDHHRKPDSRHHQLGDLPDRSQLQWRRPVRHPGGRWVPSRSPHGRQRSQSGATQTFTLTVDSSGTAPAITSGTATTFTVGSAGTFTVTSTGTPASALSESGNLPNGVTFQDNGDGTATLAGTPAAGRRGTYPFTITTSNGISPDATQDFVLTVNCGPSIRLGQQHDLLDGMPGSFSVVATGNPAPTITESGDSSALGLVLWECPVRHPDGPWHLLIQLHGVQRCVPGRDPELHPDRGLGPGLHLAQPRHLHQGSRRFLHASGQ